MHAIRGAPLIRGSPRLAAARRVPAASLSVVAQGADGKLGVVITGSTRGIGRALATRFLEEGDKVLITSRSSEGVAATVAELQAQYGEDRVAGLACDVRDAGQIAALALYAKESLDEVDLWINNAGTNGYSYANLVDTPSEVLQEVVSTNVLGTLLCCREALALCTEQGSGHIFCMLGAGSGGDATKKYAAYGMSKAGMGQLVKSLQQEAVGTGVGVHLLSPGLVYTELVASGQYAFGRSGRFFVNTIAEAPETVAEDLVPQLRAFGGQKGGSKKIEYLTLAKALKKFYGRVVKGDYVDRWFPEDDPKCPEEIKKQEKVSVGVFKRFMQQLGVTDDK